MLDLAVKQINTNTDLTVSYEQHKQGRTITGFTFKFKAKPKPKSAKALKDERDLNTMDMFVSMTDNQRFAFAKKIAHLPEVSHLAKGQANQSYDAFAEQIAKDLLDNDKQKVYLPFKESWIQNVIFKTAFLYTYLCCQQNAKNLLLNKHYLAFLTC